MIKAVICHPSGFLAWKRIEAFQVSVRFTGSLLRRLIFRLFCQAGKSRSAFAERDPLLHQSWRRQRQPSDAVDAARGCATAALSGVVGAVESVVAAKLLLLLLLSQVVPRDVMERSGSRRKLMGESACEERNSSRAPTFFQGILAAEVLPYGAIAGIERKWWRPVVSVGRRQKPRSALRSTAVADSILPEEFVALKASKRTSPNRRGRATSQIPRQLLLRQRVSLLRPSSVVVVATGSDIDVDLREFVGVGIDAWRPGDCRFVVTVDAREEESWFWRRS